MTHHTTSSPQIKENNVSAQTAITPNSKNIFRTIKDKQNPYVQINRIPLNDITLSWKAKGLLTYMMSMPDGWEVHISEIMRHGKDGLESVTSGFKELERAGYIHRYQERTKGRFDAWITLVYEVPSLNPHHIKLVEPERGKPRAEKPKTENPKLVITEDNKTDSINNYSRDTPPVKETASVGGNYSEAKLKRNLLAMKTAKEISATTPIEEKAKEILFHIQHRNISITPTEEHAYRAAIKLLKAGKWQKPKAMIDAESQAREQAAKQEKQQEIKDSRGKLMMFTQELVNRPSYAPNAAEHLAKIKAGLAIKLTGV